MAPIFGVGGIALGGSILAAELATQMPWAVSLGFVLVFFSGVGGLVASSHSA